MGDLILGYTGGDRELILKEWEEFDRVKSAGGVVWYYREAGDQESPPAVAAEVNTGALSFTGVTVMVTVCTVLWVGATSSVAVTSTTYSLFPP